MCAPMMYPEESSEPKKSIRFDSKEETSKKTKRKELCLLDRFLLIVCDVSKKQFKTAEILKAQIPLVLKVSHFLSSLCSVF